MIEFLRLDKFFVWEYNKNRFIRAGINLFCKSLYKTDEALCLLSYCLFHVVLAMLHGRIFCVPMSEYAVFHIVIRQMFLKKDGFLIGQAKNIFVKEKTFVKYRF